MSEAGREMIELSSGYLVTRNELYSTMRDLRRFLREKRFTFIEFVGICRQTEKKLTPVILNQLAEIGLKTAFSAGDLLYHHVVNIVLDAVVIKDGQLKIIDPRKEKAEETIILKNGQEVEEHLVAVTMNNLRILIGRNPIAFVELIRYSRNSEHEMHLLIQWELEDLNFLKNGIVYPEIKDIILCAVTGERAEDMELVNPRKIESPKTA